MPQLTITIKVRDSRGQRVKIDKNLLRPTKEDLQAVGERQKARIVTRTLSGKDYLNRPFAPYSTKGPYYFYPTDSRRPRTSRIRAAQRMAKKFRGGKLTRSKLGIRFESYAAMKKALGRSGGVVDLFSAKNHPHMLNSIVVQVQGNLVVLSIYGEGASRAQGHNEGTDRLPQRRFFDLSPEDRTIIAQDLADRIQSRMTGKSKKGLAQVVDVGWDVGEASIKLIRK